MAGCGSRKKKYNGKEGSQVKKTIKDTKDFVGDKEESLPPPDNFKKTKPKKPMNKGLKKLKEKAPEVVKEMGYKNGGKVKSHRGDGCAMRGKTKGRMV